ncbi:T9SS type A sorting domain-containing protein [Algoriphagus yeomjeoni]|uniref:Putative secreted protein (Por secretion system target) n=1 Tax=Algoriphagus yeomjeoni TaxID=291403 RepID=A0A327PPJ8_9BACT|nr:T9SS type A sorting domain-containing protein [Algoriphagus yeomjeoni]RAI94038.1 putative secreted protein (Por secretion system target) [Algoriphagus yeomjeoni]
MKKHLLVSFGLLICLTFMSLKVTEVNPYRIYPYLQVYGEGKMQLTWFSNSLTSSSIKLTGESGNVLYEGDVTGEPVPNIYYTSQEKSQVLTGLEQGSWIESDEVFRYRMPIELPAGTVVNYLVKLAGEDYAGAFTMPASKANWDKIRFMALADSETDPRGRVTNRAWYPGNPIFRPITTVPELWKQKFGSTVEQGIEIPNYMLTEQVGYNENLKVINSRNPNFIIMPGDLVQGGGYQPGWDEFFRQNAGTMGNGLSSYAIIPALGNWESYGAISGGYGTNERGEFLPVVGRNRFHTYFETPIEDPLQKHKKSYYRVDYGPVTILTLDSSNGTPDQTAADFEGQPKLTGKQYTVPGTDTQENYTLAQYNAAGGNDLSGFEPGSDQYLWLEENLKDAKENGQLIFVQYHHIAYSSGEHGVPMNHELSVGQVGTPLRVLNPLLENYGVIAVFSGHDEIFERSFVDEDGDGKGILYYDVGVAGDGMRGEKRDWLGNPFNTLDYNPYRKWTADQSSVEQWNTSGANPVLVDGGKHYGHLEVNLEKKVEGDQEFAIVNFTPVYIFPVLDQNYNLQKVERRVYNDEVSLKIPLRTTESRPTVKDRVELELNNEGKITLIPEQVFTNWPISFIYTVSLSKSDFSCENIGAQEVTVIIKDDKGTTWEEKIEVVVLDKIAPILVTKNLEVQLDLTKGQVELSPEDFIQAISDNCRIREVTLNKLKVTCEDVGKEITVELRAVDFSGNVTEKNATVIVKSFTSKPVTITGSESICVGTNQTLTLKSEAAFEVVRWRKNGTEISGATGKTLEIEGTGTYKAIIRYGGACLFETEEFIVTAANTTPVTITGSETICVGTKQTLTLKSEAAFEVVKWRRNGTEITGATGKTLEIEGGGTYQAIVRTAGGCLVETPNFVVESANSTPVTITGSETICVGTKQTLTLKSEAAFEVVKWRRNGTEITGATGKTLEIEGGGTYQAIVRTAGGCLVETPNFVVESANSTPVTITGSETICVGTKQTLTLKSEAAFEVVKWRRNGTEITGATGKTLEIESGGTYQAIVRTAGGCLVETADFIVKETATTDVKITGPTSICAGDNKTLNLTSEGDFEVVRWRRNGTEIPGATSKTLEIAEGGSYHAIVRFAGGCLVETSKFEVKTEAKPSGEIVVDGNILRAPEGNFTYQWYRNGEKIPEATQRNLTVNQMGEFSVELTNEAGCTARLASVNMTISGIFNPSIVVSEELRIFPNPASSQVEIQVLGDLKFAESSMRIYDQNGKEVSSSVEVIRQSSNAIILAIPRLSAGTYVIMVEGQDNRVFVGKLIKQ